MYLKIKVLHDLARHGSGFGSQVSGNDPSGVLHSGQLTIGDWQLKTRS